MEVPLLKEQNVYPSREILEDALGTSYSTYEELMSVVSGADYGLIPEWRFYRDGKVWLCKTCYKKKTIFWLSVYQGFFKTAFYFTGKNSAGVLKLDIDGKIKEEFKHHKAVGQLMPLIINVRKKGQINDLLQVIRYKKNLK